MSETDGQRPLVHLQGMANIVQAYSVCKMRINQCHHMTPWRKRPTLLFVNIPL